MESLLSLAIFQLKIGWDAPFYNLVASVIQLFFDTKLALVLVGFAERGSFHRQQRIPDLHEEPCRDLTLHRMGVKMLRWTENNPKLD